MTEALGFAFVVLLCFQAAEFSDPADCVIELECEECVPDNMPLVTSHAALAGAVRAPHGDELALSCGGGSFESYPALHELRAACEAGRLRVRHDAALRHVLELGCQEGVFDDVLHPVEHCGAPLQGRAYQTQERGGGVRHVATACVDADRAATVRVRAAPRGALALPAHSDARSPLSILGNFNRMFDARTSRDAERLYSDDARLTRRVRELFKHDRFSFAAQELTAARLLAPRYFDDRDVRAAEFSSNKVAAWRSVADGNLRHVHADVGALVRSRRGADVDVYAGTHGVLALGAGAAARQVYLRAGRRFPVPKYIWTVLHAARAGRGVALVVLNDPFVTVSEIREAVFCNSTCGAVPWLAELRRHRNYERPLHGLTFCCSLPEFADVVHEMPRLFNASIQQFV